MIDDHLDFVRIKDLVFASLDQISNECRPAGLVAGAETGAVVPVEVFVEQDIVAPVKPYTALPGVSHIDRQLLDLSLLQRMFHYIRIQIQR